MASIQGTNTVHKALCTKLSDCVLLSPMTNPSMTCLMASQATQMKDTVAIPTVYRAKIVLYFESDASLKVVYGVQEDELGQAVVPLPLVVTPVLEIH